MLVESLKVIDDDENTADLIGAVTNDLTACKRVRELCRQRQR